MTQDTMREMTAMEMHEWYVKGRWPCGHGTEYIKGPRGGVSLNVFCPVCGLGLNVIDPRLGIPTGFGQVIAVPEGYTPPVSWPTRWRQRLHKLWH